MFCCNYCCFVRLFGLWNGFCLVELFDVVLLINYCLGDRLFCCLFIACNSVGNFGVMHIDVACLYCNYNLLVFFSDCVLL